MKSEQRAKLEALKKEFVPKSWVAFKHKYTFGMFKADLIAGITVGIVALPLSMAFAIASGLAPINGLYTAIIAGFLISMLGGSYSQVGGPAGAFVVIVYGIMEQRGYEGLILVTLIAGVILLVAAFSRVGALIKYIPYPLIIGFTAGIAVIIVSLQVKDFFGLEMAHDPAQFIPKWKAIISSFSTLQLPTVYVGGGTLVLIILMRRFIPGVPWGIISIVVSGTISWFLKLPVATIATRFGEMPRGLPSFHLPNMSILFSDWPALIPDALTVAFLIGISSLLSAVVADGMTGRRHKSNCELMAQGIANITSVLFGGMPATGAIARTATSIKAGAKTPFAGVIHSLTIAVIVLVFSPIVSQVPLTSLAALLIVIGWNMSQAYHFRHLFKSPPGDIAILLVSFFLTIFVDLTVGVGVGMILAAFIFMKRVADSSKISDLGLKPVKDIEDEESNKEFIEQRSIPHGIDIYEITGPFFFGLADSLKDVLSNLARPPIVFILRMKKVPTIDASGLHALKEFYLKCKRDKTILMLSEIQEGVLKSLDKYGLSDLVGQDMIFTGFEKTINRAKEEVKSHG